MLPSRVCAFTQFCQSNSLSLAFADQIAFKLSEGPHDAEKQMGSVALTLSGAVRPLRGLDQAATL